MDNPGRPSEPTSEEFNSWLDSLFSPVVLGKEAEDYGNAITAFENLTGYFVCRTFGAPKLITKALACVRIDYVGLVFQRAHRHGV